MPRRNASECRPSTGRALEEGSWRRCDGSSAAVTALTDRAAGPMTDVASLMGFSKAVADEFVDPEQRGRSLPVASSVQDLDP